MTEETQFAIGAKVRCSDGSCGEVRRLVIDPAPETVTHLVVQPLEASVLSGWRVSNLTADPGVWRSWASPRSG